MSETKIKWGVKLLNYDGSIPWCDWSPFHSSKRWDYDINIAYRVLNKLGREWINKAVVEEYKE